MARGAVTGLVNEPKAQPCSMVASNRKPYRIGSTILGQARTGGSVTQIAKFPQLLIRWFRAFVSRCGTVANPSAAQRKPRRMKPAAILEFARRHKEWTGHSRRLLLRDEGIVLSEEIDG
jgi:hypothetical protein